ARGLAKPHVAYHIHWLHSVGAPRLIETGDQSILKLLFRVVRQDMGKVLSDEEFLSTLDNRYANRVVIRIQDVLAMARRMHEALVRGDHIRGLRHVFRDRVEA